MRHLARWLGRFLVAAAILACLAATGLLALESTGVLGRRTEALLADWIAEEPGLSIELRGLSLDWSGPSVVLEGLHLAGERGEVFLEELRLDLDLSRDARSTLAAVEAHNGRVVLEQDFVEAVARAVAGVEEHLRERFGVDRTAAAAPTDGPPAVPTLTLSDLEVALRPPSAEGPTGAPGPLVELGRGNAVLALEREADLALRGGVDLPQPGAPPRPLLFRATLTDDGRLRVDAVVRNLLVAGRDSNLAPLLPPPFGDLDASAKLSLDLGVDLWLDGARPPEAAARLRVEDGRVFVAGQGPVPLAVDGLGMDAAVTWYPTPASLWSGLTARGTFSLETLSRRLEGGARFTSTDGLALDALVRDLGLGEDLLLDGGLAEGSPLLETWRALGLGGTADVHVGLRLPPIDLASAPGATARAFDFARDADLALEVRARESGTFRYEGWGWSGPRDGIPLPLERVSARVAYAYRGGAPRRDLCALLDVVGQHGTGEARAVGLIAAPTVFRGEADMDLIIEVADRAIDAPLLEALSHSRATDWIAGALGPRGGTADATIRLRSRAEQGGLSTDSSLRVKDAGLAWEALPTDLWADSVDLVLRMGATPVWRTEHEQARATGVAFVAHGRSSSVDDLLVRGAFHSHPIAAPGGSRPTRIDRQHQVTATGTGLALRGTDWDALTVSAPELAEAAAETGIKGRASFRWVDLRRPSDGRREVALEAAPAGVELLPRAFPMVTRAVVGRLCAVVREEGEGAAIEPRGQVAAVLEGDWVEGMHPVAGLTLPLGEAAGTTGRLDFTVGGLQPRSDALLGALAARPDGAAGGEPAGDWPLALHGAVDLRGRLPLQPGAPSGAGELAGAKLDLFLRGNAFSAGTLELEHLEGPLRLQDGALLGPRITGDFAGTPLVLEGARFALDPSARRGEVYFETRLSATDLPLDRAHVGPFLEAEAAEALFDGIEWRGTVDLDGLALSLAEAGDGRDRMTLSGRMVPSSVSALLGTSLEITSGVLDLEELVLEGSRVRAWGRAHDVVGRIAGRAVESASFLFSYVDQRLAFEDLDAGFAGGRLTSLGAGAQGGQDAPGGSGTSGRSGGSALALDLAAPHRVSVALEVRELDAGQVLAGAFGGLGEDRGRIDGALRLEALPESLLDARGSGWVRVRDARLGSVPLFRELFAQLGFDATAVFDSMRARFVLQDGSFSLDSMEAHSPLLKLVGDGELDLDGSLRADLEVRYSLVDRLGPFGRIVYWFQNSLATVHARGDLFRPLVYVENSLLDLLRSAPKAGPHLPLPGWSRPPARF